MTDIWQVNWFKAVLAPLDNAIVATDCTAVDGDKGESKRAKIEQDKCEEVVTVQDTVKVELKVETVEPLSVEAADAMDVEVKKIMDGASNGTVAVRSGEC